MAFWTASKPALAARPLASSLVPAGVFGSTVQMRGMASIKALKLRMKSIASVKKITQSMKLVASSKVKTAQTRMEVGKKFYQSLERVEPMLAPELATSDSSKLIVACTADRGMCGAVNSSVVKLVKAEARKDKSSHIVLVGEKGRQGLQREVGDRILFGVTRMGKRLITFSDMTPVVDRMLQLKFDTATIIRNHFLSLLTFKTIPQTIISQEHFLKNPNPFPGYEIDDDNNEMVLADLYQFYLGALLYNAVLENKTIEFANRMTTMDSATRNANQLLSAITLAYNRQRQANITKELCEVVGGSFAIQEEEAQRAAKSKAK